MTMATSIRSEARTSHVRREVPYNREGGTHRPSERAG